MDEPSGESKEEEVMGEGIGESEMQQLVSEWVKVIVLCFHSVLWHWWLKDIWSVKQPVPFSQPPLFSTATNWRRTLWGSWIIRFTWKCPLKRTWLLWVILPTEWISDVPLNVAKAHLDCQQRALKAEIIDSVSICVWTSYGCQEPVMAQSQGRWLNIFAASTSPKYRQRWSGDYRSKDIGNW